MQFEWDDEKEKKNIKKHGISFRIAAHVFDDDMRIELFDEEHSITEERFITIGLVDRIITVVYTDRTDAIRIISARRATPEEERRYANGHR